MGNGPLGCQHLKPECSEEIAFFPKMGISILASKRH